MEFIDKNYKDLIAFTIIIICLIALIFKNKQSTGLSQTLTYIITSCLGFLFRGSL